MNIDMEDLEKHMQMVYGKKDEAAAEEIKDESTEEKSEETDAKAEETKEESTVEATSDKDESSLHNDNSEAETKEEGAEASEEEAEDTENPLELSDDLVLNYLKEKGIETDSIDSLANKETTEFEFADPSLKVINDYIKETGRTMNDWINTQSFDLENVSNEDLLMAHLRDENPELNDEQIEFLYEDSYGKVKIDEDEMDDDEIAKAKKHNSLREIKAIQDGKKAKAHFQEIQEKYRTPVKEETKQEETENTFDESEYRSSWSEASNGLEGFDVEDDKGNTIFSFNADKADLEALSKNAVTPDSLFSERYATEDGQFNVTKFVEDTFILNNIDKIVRAAMSQAKSEGTEQVVKEMKNTSMDEMTKDSDKGGNKASGVTRLYQQLTDN